jgi:hypothetical protein
MSVKIIQPTYTCKQPSTGKQVKYRPFTVKEEKALLLALQENSIDVIINAIKNTIDICTDGGINSETAPYYDIEYIFLQIRSKSVGEIIEMVGSCECDPKAKTDFSIDIADVYLDPVPSGTLKSNIPDTGYTIEFKHPAISDFAETFKTSGENATETVANCIVAVYNDDEVMNWNKTEKLEFIESMSSKQQNGIASFLKNMPMTKLPAKYTCKSCGKVHSDVISGFDNFFV